MMEQEYKYMVSVRCFTFNHAPYIVNALNGFTMQQTSFPFVCTIVDDHSTDGEPETIRQYMEEHFDMGDPTNVRREETDDYSLIFARHKTNSNCYFAVFLLKYNHYSIKKPKMPYLEEWLAGVPYTALCEGDDYWIDQEKLQKQVDYFKNHTDCGLVYTAFRQKNDINGDTHDVYTSGDIQHDNTFKWKLLEQKVMVGTCTTMIKSDLRNKIYEIKDDFQGYMMGDTQLWFHASRLSQIGYIPDVTGVYRKQPTGATATFDAVRRAKFIRSCLDLDLHLSYKYGAPAKTIKTIKDKFGVYCLNLYLRLHQYELAEEINKNYFHDSFLYAFSIKISKLLRLNKLYVLGPLHHLEARAGLLNMK